MCLCVQYLALLRAMVSALDINEIEGHQSMAHTPEPDRVRLMEVRDASSRLLVERITILKDRIAKQDEIFHKYEQTLKDHAYELSILVFLLRAASLCDDVGSLIVSIIPKEVVRCTYQLSRLPLVPFNSVKTKIVHKCRLIIISSLN